MNVLQRPSVSAAHRARVLRALGVTPWVQRSAASAAQDPTPEVRDRVDDAPASAQHCVLVLAQESGARELDLLDRALAPCGPALAHAPRVVVRDGQLAGVPAADAYLVFGEAQAHALGRTLAAEVLQRAQIVLVDTLATVLTEPAAKRRLWMALRRLRRASDNGAG